MNDRTELKVKGDTDIGSLAKSMVMTAQEQDGSVRVRAMGPNAVSQMVKGWIRARQLLAAQGKTMDVVPAFETKVEGRDEITLITFTAFIMDM